MLKGEQREHVNTKSKLVSCSHDLRQLQIESHVNSSRDNNSSGGNLSLLELQFRVCGQVNEVFFIIVIGPLLVLICILIVVLTCCCRLCKRKANKVAKIKVNTERFDSEKGGLDKRIVELREIISKREASIAAHEATIRARDSKIIDLESRVHNQSDIIVDLERVDAVHCAVEDGSLCDSSSTILDRSSLRGFDYDSLPRRRLSRMRYGSRGSGAASGSQLAHSAAVQALGQGANGSTPPSKPEGFAEGDELDASGALSTS